MSMSIVSSWQPGWKTRAQAPMIQPAPNFRCSGVSSARK
jgi:hypothetical protein